MKSQLELYNTLTKDCTLQEIQNYIKEVIHIRGFDTQTIEQEMLILIEEVGELAKSIRKEAADLRIDKSKLHHYSSIESEVADVFIVLLSICNQLDIDLFDVLKDKESLNCKRKWTK